MVGCVCQLLLVAHLAVIGNESLETMRGALFVGNYFLNIETGT